MKSGLKLMTIIVFFVGIGTTSKAQRENHESKIEANEMQLVFPYSGTVAGWESNDDFVYCGFYLQTNIEKYLFKFSPTMGSQLVSELKIGNEVTVNALEEPGLDERTLRLVSITTDGKRIYNRPIRGASQAPAENFIFGSNEIAALQKNKQGQITGLILSDHTILRFPPNLSDQLNKVVSMGAFIFYSGYQILRNGEFSNVNYTIVRCNTITVNDKQYLII